MGEGGAVCSGQQTNNAAADLPVPTEHCSAGAFRGAVGPGHALRQGAFCCRRGRLLRPVGPHGEIGELRHSQLGGGPKVGASSIFAAPHLHWGPFHIALLVQRPHAFSQIILIMVCA